MTKAIRHQFFFAHPPEIVWEYLTKSELISQWLMDNNFVLIVGHDFQFRATPMPDFQFDGVVYCKVLEIIPLKKLAYSWKSGPGAGKIALDSVVEWTLQTAENGTELLLVHSGFKEADFTMRDMVNGGWQKNVHKIISILNTMNDGATKL